MFKKVALKVALAVFLACFVTASAQATPWYCYTDYISNGGFDTTTAWSYSNGAYRETNQDDPCDIFYGYKIKAAALTVPYARVSQQFTTNTSSALGWTMSFEVQAQSLAGASSYDEIMITVDDITTGQSEYFYVHGSQLTSTCQRFDFTLSHNYTGHQVRLSFNAQPFTSLDMYIDNVSFWGRYC